MASKKKIKDFIPPVTLHQLDWLEWIAIGLSVLYVLSPVYQKILFSFLVPLPIVGLVLNGVTRPSLASLISFSIEEGKTKYDLADFIEFPGLAILFRLTMDYEFESFYSLLKVGTVGLILLLIILFATHKLVEKSNVNIWIIYLAIIGNISIYSYAATYGVNIYYDNSVPKMYPAKVIDKSIRVRHRRRGRTTTYYLKVESWGHHHDPEQLSVSSSKYYETVIGSSISIEYSEGLLGIPWYFVK